MPTRNLTCISCPVGCDLTIDEVDGQPAISGNRCPKGVTYALQELTDPRRILTTSVTLLHADGRFSSLPVRSQTALPKHLIFDVMQLCHNMTVSTPIQMGEILIEDLAGSGIPLIASKSVAH